MPDEEHQPKRSKMTMPTPKPSAEDTTIATSATGIKTCAHWVKRKKRYCKMSVAKGKDYCGEHEPIVDMNGSKDSPQDNQRIPCPLDGKHTISRKHLNKHLKICNARPIENLPEYIKKNINAGDENGGDEQEDLKSIKLSNLEDEEFYQTIDKIKEFYKNYVENKIEKIECHHKCMDEELAKEEYGKESRKHLVQVAALLGILEIEKSIGDSTSFIEFGAGKGQLAYHLAKLLDNKNQSQVILLDRMSLRHKKDNKIENRDTVQRIRADIADFCIDKLNILRNTQYCVAVSKHLCGGATDLALRCITNAQEKFTNFIMIALCCHHRCDWRSFVGKNFFKKHNVSQREFVIITKMVSWAICGTGMSRERRKALEDQELTPQEITEINSNQRLSLTKREAIGLMCKRVLDYARLDFLRQHGYDAELKYYVSGEVTLENVVLLARKRIISEDTI